MFVHGGDGETWRGEPGPTRSSTRKSPTSTPPCSPLHRRGPDATGWICACGPTALGEIRSRRRGQTYTNSARATGKADADQGADLGGEPSQARTAHCRALILSSSLDFRAVEAVSKRPENQREAGRPARSGRAASISSSRPADSRQKNRVLVQCSSGCRRPRPVGAPWRHMFALFRLRDRA